MKNILFAGLILLSTSCTQIYFENPVPQNGQPLPAPPPGLQGAYEVLDDAPQESLSAEPSAETDEAPDPLEDWLKLCFYFEKSDGGRLLVSEEIRFHERDWANIKSFLAQKKADGTLADYTMGEHSILYTTAVDTAGEQASAYVPIIKSGTWYILTRSQKPGWLFDFDPKNASQIGLDVKNDDSNQFLPGTDSLSMKTSALVARQRAGAFFFNAQAAGETNWSLIHCTQDAQGDVQLSIGYASDSLIEQNRAHYEAITHFAKTPGNNYLINPDDRALDVLLADQKLFKTMRLRKLKE